MLNIIFKATKHFCTDIIGETIKETNNPGKDFYGAAIGLNVGKEEQQWYLLFQKETLNTFSSVLLFEDNLSEDELDDLVKEVANMIIGSAKVLLKEAFPERDFSIDTPELLGHVPNMEILKLEDFLLYEMKDRSFVIGKKVH